MSKQTVGWGCALVAAMGLWSVSQLPVQGQFGGGEAMGRRGRMKDERRAAVTAEEVIKATLEKKMKTPLDHEAEPLNEILDAISNEYDIPIVFDNAALEELGISIDSEVTLKLHDISLKSAFNLMLGSKELCYLIKHEVLFITTQERADESLSTHVYRVDDLLDSKQQRFNGIDQNVDSDELINLVISNVEQESWMKNGPGCGEIEPYPPGMLVISQTPRVHEAIEKLFSDLRRTKRQILDNNKPASTVLKPVTKGFAINVELGENPEQSRLQLADVIKRSVDWSSTGESFGEADAMINVLPNRVLVRHLPKVQQQVRVVLKDMRVLQETPRFGYSGNKSGSANAKAGTGAANGGGGKGSAGGFF